MAGRAWRRHHLRLTSEGCNREDHRETDCHRRVGRRSIMKTNEATIPGSVSEVDAQKNTLTIKTPKGALTVPIASAAVDRIRPGDAVVLRLGLVDIGPPP